MIGISPSLLAADFSNLEAELVRVETADMLHLDIMDGRFVPNLSFGPSVVAAIRGKTKLFFDIHLMVLEPERYVEPFVKAGADGITFHVESTCHIHRCLSMVKESGLKCGVALNPGTPLSALDAIIGDIDMVLIMTVNPGFGGQGLIPSSFDKVASTRRMITLSGRDITLQVDGGVNEETAGRLKNCGANNLVAGVAIFQSPKPDEVISRMRITA